MHLRHRVTESTLECHDALNPKLWENNRMRPEVREKLLVLADAFGKHCKVPDALVQDVMVVGGSAGYNWTPYSDIDLHLLVDRDALGPRELVDEYLQSKKKLWSLTHAVTIRGLPVEGYVQDPDEKSPEGQGIYSVRNDLWRREPSKCQGGWISDAAFDSKVKSFQDQIDHMIAMGTSTESLLALKKRIADMRRAGLSAGGEFNSENLVFKSLRNNGYLKKMVDYIRARTDAQLSLEGEER